MKHWLLTLLLAVPWLALAQATHPRHRAPHHTATRPTSAPTVYVCGGGSAYHSSDNCAGLNRCTHGVSTVTVTEAERMGRRPCKKCY
ncbi:MAG: hypothetical protein EOO60_13015 [Hymenobacter sp.]|nr:MAG: hypothetical protein EOO60_13015 [Hymenobacter sp.]